MGLPRQARRKSLPKLSDRPKKSLLVRTTDFTLEVGPTNSTPALSFAFTPLNTSTQYTPNLRANPLVSSRESSIQSNCPAATFQSFNFQAGPTRPFAHPSLPFTFQAGLRWGIMTERAKTNFLPQMTNCQLHRPLDHSLHSSYAYILVSLSTSIPFI
jgi:hypothetical protein